MARFWGIRAHCKYLTWVLRVAYLPPKCSPVVLHEYNADAFLNAWDRSVLMWRVYAHAYIWSTCLIWKSAVYAAVVWCQSCCTGFWWMLIILYSRWFTASTTQVATSRTILHWRPLSSLRTSPDPNSLCKKQYLMFHTEVFKSVFQVMAYPVKLEEEKYKWLLLHFQCCNIAYQQPSHVIWVVCIYPCYGYEGRDRKLSV